MHTAIACEIGCLARTLCRPLHQLWRQSSRRRARPAISHVTKIQDNRRGPTLSGRNAPSPRGSHPWQARQGHAHKSGPGVRHRAFTHVTMTTRHNSNKKNIRHGRMARPAVGPSGRRFDVMTDRTIYCWYPKFPHKSHKWRGDPNSANLTVLRHGGE